MNGQSRTVLIVDDIPFVRKTLKQILTSHGYKIVGEAENGEQAIELYHENKPDLVTMDLVMPLMNGVEATRTIKRNYPDASSEFSSHRRRRRLTHDSIHRLSIQIYRSGYCNLGSLTCDRNQRCQHIKTR